MKINAENVSGGIVQIGMTNTVTGYDFLKKHEKELLRLINKHAPSDKEKDELISSLNAIENESQSENKPAEKLLNFVKSIGKNVVSGAIVAGLEYLVNS